MGYRELQCRTAIYLELPSGKWVSGIIELCILRRMTHLCFHVAI